LALAGFLFTGGNAWGGIIFQVQSVSGPGGTGSGFPSTLDPNDDNAIVSANALQLTETFTAVDTISARLGTEFSGGVTEYFVQVNVTNNTGITWTDFHFSLDPAVPGDGLDFDFPIDFPHNSTAFSTVVSAEDTLDFSGGTVPSGLVVGFSLSIDVPDGVGLISLNARPTVAPVPAVPEPSSLTLFSLALMGAAGHTFRRNRRK
jgi:hypothetical protein